MNREEKLKLAKQGMQISGVFTLLVAALLLINFVQLKKYEPLESATLNALVEQLNEDPNNEQLMEEIRDFDLLVRKAYFTSTWQVKTGVFLLLFGGIVFAVSLKIFTDIRHAIGRPDPEGEPFLQARKASWKWLLITGLVVFGLAFVAAFFSNNYIDNYFPDEGGSTAIAAADDGIQVIEITDGTVPAGGQGTAEGNLAGLMEGGQTENGQAAGNGLATGRGQTTTGGQGSGRDGSLDAGTGSGVEASKSTAGAAGADLAGRTEPEQAERAAEKPYGPAEIKKHHNTFRGPWGLGIAYHKNIPVQWDGGAGTNVIWKVALSKHGYNSPVIWGDKIFLAGADNSARIVSCFNRHTGQLLWEKSADNIPGSPSVMPKVTEDTGLSAPTMAVDGYRAYAIFGTGDVIAFDMEGNRVWARNLGVPQNHYGHSSSLMVWNNKLIVQYDTGRGGRMLALNGRTGETVWDVARDNHISWASPILIEVDGKMQVVTNTDPSVAGHDIETGEEIWKLDVMMGEVGPSCAYDNGLVFANNEYASLVAINPEPNAEVVWESYDYLSEAASPVAHDGLLYLATSYGVFVCYDTKTGEQVWEKDFGVTLYSSPMIVEGKIYIMGNNGVMHIMKADRTGTVISEPELGEPSYAIPAFAEGRIYIRGDESLYCIGK
ncbi:MAG: PQQ-binding-like beta-propeller repeat protein [Bacteroidales bacterium]